MKILKLFGPYMAFLAVAVGLSYATHHLEWVTELFLDGAEGFYLSLALLFLLLAMA